MSIFFYGFFSLSLHYQLLFRGKFSFMQNMMQNLLVIISVFLIEVNYAQWGLESYEMFF